MKVELRALCAFRVGGGYKYDFPIKKDNSVGRDEEIDTVWTKKEELSFLPSYGMDFIIGHHSENHDRAGGFIEARVANCTYYRDDDEVDILLALDPAEMDSEFFKNDGWIMEG